MISRLRRWWQVKTGRVETPFDGHGPFWILSLVLHIMLLIYLALYSIPPEVDESVVVEADPPAAPVVDDDLTPPPLTWDNKSQEELGASGASEEDIAASLAPIVDVSVDLPVEEEMPEHERGVNEILRNLDRVTADTQSRLLVTGSTGEAVQGAAGAIDRITEEIVNHLEERKTTVVWMFDRSASLLAQRDEILARFDKVYEELGMIEASGNEAFTKHSGEPLLTQVYSFGNTVNRIFDEPTNSVTAIKESVRNIPVDDTGVENVFEAILIASGEMRNVRRQSRVRANSHRNVMLIVISDEAGDDELKLDLAVKQCKDLEIPVYVVGVPAPFGRQETMVKWIDPDPEYDQSEQWAPVRQGPESLYPERLNLQFSGVEDDLDAIDSGFGPFSLTRICYETGGIYFTVHPNRDVDNEVRRRETAAYSSHLTHFFDPHVMRKYKPEYVSLEKYAKRLQENRARWALVQAARRSWLEQLEPPQMRFPKLDEATFVNSVSAAQQAAARLEPKINAIYQILKEGEADRPHEASLRWQAGYDLAMGRVLAVKVRVESYNAMLAMAKTKLKFEDPKNNVWNLEAADEISTGSQAKKMAEKAQMYLNRVIAEHPNTPWAYLAAKELETPIGWKWTESYQEPPRPREPREANNNNNNNNNGPRMERARNLPKPKPKRPAPKL